MKRSLEFNLTTTIDHLPEEVLFLIISVMDYFQIHSFRFISKKFHGLIHRFAKLNSISWNYQELLKSAIKTQNIPLMDWLKYNASCCFNYKFKNPNDDSNRPTKNLFVFEYCALKGNLKMLKWAKEQNFPWNSYVPIFLSRHEKYEELEWVLENGCPCDETTCEVVASHGKLEILKKLIKLNCPWNKVSINQAAAGQGHRIIIEWMYDRYGDDGIYHFWVKRAATGGHLDLLKWAMDKFQIEHLQNFIFDRAAFGGHINILKWLIEEKNQSSFNKYSLYEHAALGGHLNVFEYIETVSGSIDVRSGGTQLVMNSVVSGNLDLIKYLKRNNYRYKKIVGCILAIEHEKWDILKWLLNDDHCFCEDRMNINYTLNKEQEKIIIRAREKGCLWDEQILKILIHTINEDKVEYLTDGE